MTTYAIGDVQGCCAQLIALLRKIKFNPDKDRLWFVGDLVNRGPQSLKTLRVIKSLEPEAITLGNHDLALMAAYYGASKPQPGDTISEVLNAPDVDDLIDFLHRQKIFHWDQTQNRAMCHAGLHPHWSTHKAQELAQELESVLQGNAPYEFFDHMYGNTPNQWSDSLQGYDRLRTICNYFTRIRLCDSQGKIDFTYKGELKNAPSNLIPWFNHPQLQQWNAPLIFGHWAALNGQTHSPQWLGIDTGCVWGKTLTAINISSHERFQVAAV